MWRQRTTFLCIIPKGLLTHKSYMWEWIECSCWLHTRKCKCFTKSPKDWIKNDKIGKKNNNNKTHTQCCVSYSTFWGFTHEVIVSLKTLFWPHIQNSPIDKIGLNEYETHRRTYASLARIAICSFVLSPLAQSHVLELFYVLEMAVMVRRAEGKLQPRCSVKG